MRSCEHSPDLDMRSGSTLNAFDQEQMMGKSILAVDLPPPLGGLSSVNLSVANMVRERADIEVIDMIGPGSSGNKAVSLRKCINYFKLSVSLFLGFRKARRVYFVANSGLGIWLNILLASTCRIKGVPLILHHHTFAYIHNRTLGMSLLTKIMGRSVKHVFLCGCMAEKFLSMYSTNGDYLVAINPVKLTQNGSSPSLTDKSQVVLGHLSNLTVAKGVHTVLETALKLKQLGLSVKLLLAGPARTEVEKQLIAQYQISLGDSLEYIGPVYNETKDQFFSQVDIFLFPTEYPNEAQPLVLFEAMSAGALVVATPLGCISEQLKDVGVLSTVQDFTEVVRQRVEDLIQKPSVRSEWSNRSRQMAQQYSSDSEEAFLKLKELIIAN